MFHVGKGSGVSFSVVARHVGFAPVSCHGRGHHHRSKRARSGSRITREDGEETDIWCARDALMQGSDPRARVKPARLTPLYTPKGPWRVPNTPCARSFRAAHRREVLPCVHDHLMPIAAALGRRAAARGFDAAILCSRRDMTCAVVHTPLEMLGMAVYRTARGSSLPGHRLGPPSPGAKIASPQGGQAQQACIWP